MTRLPGLPSRGDDPRAAPKRRPYYLAVALAATAWLAGWRLDDPAGMGYAQVNP